MQPMSFFFVLLATQLQAQNYYRNIQSQTACLSTDIHIIADSGKIKSLQAFEAQIDNNFEIKANTKAIKIFLPTTCPILYPSNIDTFDLSRCNFTALKQLQTIEIYTCYVRGQIEYLPSCFFYNAPQLPPTIRQVKIDRFPDENGLSHNATNPLVNSFSDLPALRQLECYTAFLADAFLEQDIKIDSLIMPLGYFDKAAKNTNIRQLILIDLTIKHSTYMLPPREEIFSFSSFATALRSLPNTKATLVGGKATKKKYKTLIKFYPDLAARISWKKA